MYIYIYITKEIHEFEVDDFLLIYTRPSKLFQRHTLNESCITGFSRQRMAFAFEIKDITFACK